MGIMDMMGLLTGGSEEGQPSMMEQIRGAGESFNQLARDIAEIRAQNVEIRAQNVEILNRLKEWGNRENGRNAGSESGSENA